MAAKSIKKQYVVCIQNREYKASLVVRRIYECMPDSAAEERGLLRVIDESGEDYLYPAKFFIAIDLPKAAGKAFAMAT